MMETEEEVLTLDSGGHPTTALPQAGLIDLQQQQLIVTTAPSPGGSSIVQIQEPQRGIEMIEFFRKQREREKFCDVILHVQGKQFFAHRMVLAAGSAYFDSMFKSKKTIRENLAISCQDPEIFKAFLNYFYTGSISLKKENVGELIRLSHHFLVGKLKAYCADFLERYIDAANSLHVKQISEKFQLPSLTKSAIAFIQTNLAEVINHEVMMDLPPKQIEQFVTDKANYGLPQDAAVKFMSRWICHDITTRERDFKQFLTHIDWRSMDPAVIVDYIDQEPLYGASERCFYYVLHSLAEKGIQIQKYDSMYQALDQRFGQEADPALGFGDNLLQMAFNSAMEGLTDSTSLLLGEPGNGSKWTTPTDLNVRSREAKSRLPLSLEQRRRRILTRILRNRSTQKWVRLSRQRRKRRPLLPDLIEESSGEEECDPVQTDAGYRCHLCPFNTKKISRLEKHLASIHAHDVTYRCCECGFTCKWNRDYFMHMKSHYEGPPYRCTSCNYDCMKIGSLISHKMSHEEQKPYQCCDCEFKCRSKANLAAHLKTHNNEKPYRCNVCGRTFASKNSLDQHAVGHNTEKTYACNICSFTTKYLNHFTNHKKSHSIPPPATPSGASSSAATTPAGSASTGKKSGDLLRCQDHHCKYTTTKKSQLESHLRSHAGVRPHPCTICGRRFLEKSHLVRHERIHYNERPFKCEECDYASTRRDKLKEHKSRHHGHTAVAKSPYKPRPHKSTKTNSFGDQTVVYAKKSTVQQSQQGGTGTGSQLRSSQDQSLSATSEIDFLTQETSGTSNAGSFSNHLVGNQGSQIDLQQLTNAGAIVQVRQFQPGKPEMQVAHTLASIPSSITAAEYQRVALKLDDLQSPQILQGRAIKLEELSGSVSQGLAGARIHHGGATMVLPSAQFQQLQAAAAAGGTFDTKPVPVKLSTAGRSHPKTTITVTSTPPNSGNQAVGDAGDFSGLSMLY